jgi:hypothetical protein
MKKDQIKLLQRIIASLAHLEKEPGPSDYKLGIKAAIQVVIRYRQKLEADQ